MLFGLFESPSEKLKRLEDMDNYNERKRKEAEEKGEPYFGLRYEDDYRYKGGNKFK